MKFGLWFIAFILCINFTFSQTVVVLDKTFSIPIPGVKVFSNKYSDTLQTNVDGEVNINSFPIDATIIFSYLPYFKSSRYTKKELAQLHNVVYLTRSSVLATLTPSKITAKEYSEDLPFFVNIINLDDNSTLQTDDASAGDRVSIVSERGISVFRSLETKKMLLVVDGIRLNDEIHRNGKIEGLMNLDKTVADRVQQIYGASFLIYSPEATGGVIEYFTHTPPTTTKKHLKLDYFGKYISASNSYINNINLTFTSPFMSSFTSWSYGKYGDIIMGKNRKGVPKPDSLYGLRLDYIIRQGDSDIVVRNSNPYKQVGTKYNQSYFFQKLRFKLNNRMNLFLNFHYVKTSDMGIYSGLTETNTDHYRFAECKFEPQKKYIASANLLINTNRRYYDFVSLNTSFITYNEYRLTRKFNNPVELDQIENLYVYNVNVDFVKLFNVNRMVYGISYQYNKLKSSAFFKNIENDSVWTGLNRYPTNGSFSHNGAIYWGYKILNSTLVINLGLRYNFKYIFADFDTTAPQLPLSFTKKEYFSSAPAAAISFSSFILPWLQTKLILSAATHSPIIDDFAKIMVKNFIVAIPTNNLKSEKSLNMELGINISPDEKFKLYGSVFISRAFDAIILKDTLLNGKDSLYFGTDRYNIATHVNIPNSVIYGSSSGFYFKHYFDLQKKIGMKFNGSINFVQGFELGTYSVMPNISPMFGNLSFKFQYHSISLRVNTQFNGAKKLADLSTVGEDYIEKASSKGFLPWQIYNAKINIKVKDFAEINLGIDNIFDKFYRQYSTAISSSGRSYVFSVKFSVK